MAVFTVRELLKFGSPRQDVELRGWVKTRRDSKNLSFLEVNDGSCRSSVQVVVDSLSPARAVLQDATPGASLRVNGDFVRSPNGKEQDFELKADRMELYGRCDPETYPIQKKKTSDEFLRTVAHLRPRTNKYAAMLRIRSELSHAIHTFFRNNGFFYVHTPIITASDCEGAGQMFQVSALDMETPPRTADGKVDFFRDFFGKKTFLTVSGQLEGEALAAALGRIYTFGPTFRAENSNTYRHCAEFWMIEPEAAFFTLEDDMALAENFLKSIVSHTVENCPEDIGLFSKFVDTSLMKTLANITDNTFERLTYADAVEILQKHNDKFETKISYGQDLGSEHERFMVEQVFKKPVILHDKPKSLGAFYMKLGDDGKTVRGMDVLVPRIGEIIGGSERENRLDVIRQKMADFKIREEDYWWYIDLRRFGTVPHSGFGLGFERVMMLLTGIGNIRDVTAFPRVPNYAEF
ncbi:MAG: asparagine--tRNA ligase [bacterium]